MSNKVGTGNGTTIVFPVSGWNAEIFDLNGPGISVPVIEKSHFGTDEWEEFFAGDLKNPGQFDVTAHFDPDLAIPVGIEETAIVITYPKGDHTTAGFDTFAGFVVDHTAAIPNKDKMTTVLTVQVSGPIVPTAST